MQHLSDAVTADCDIPGANDLEKRCYLQWRGNKPEQDAVASALQNLHNSVCYYIVASSYVKILKTGDGKAGGNLDSNAHQEVSLCADFPFAESTVAS